MEHYDIVDDPIKEYFLDKLQGLEVKKRLLMIRKDQGFAKADQHKLSPLRQTNGTLNSARNPIDGKKNGSQTDINLQKDLIVGKYLKSENPVIGVLPPPKSSNTAGLLSHYQDRGKGSMDHKQRQLKKAKEMNYLGQLGEMVATEKTQERASSIAKEFHDQKNKNDSLIKDQLKQQNDKLKEKLRERQAHSFNRSLQKQGSFTKEKDKGRSILMKNQIRKSTLLIF